MASTSFTLSESFENYINSQVESGRYASRSEVVRDALRRMKDRDDALEQLRASIETSRSQPSLGRLDRKALETLRDEVLDEMRDGVTPAEPAE